MTDFFKFIDEHGIAYIRHDHPAVYTVEEADQLVPDLPGAKTKNLFLRDDKGKRHFLVLVPSDKRVNLKALKGVLGVKRISFGSPERLKKHLGIEPGAVSLLAVYNDSEHKVEVVMDQDLWEADTFLFHPLVNTSTLVIKKVDIKRFLEATGHDLKVIDISGNVG
jgi:Ala-tRNA(Pro) deacylase